MRAGCTSTDALFALRLTNLETGFRRLRLKHSGRQHSSHQYAPVPASSLGTVFNRMEKYRPAEARLTNNRSSLRRFA